MTENKTIIIDLNNSKSANKFDTTNLMHRPALKTIEKFIEERINQYDAIDSNTRIHETITILGNRGSGKSSLLLSIEENISKDLKEKIVFLRPIDPTLFESRQNILITLIALIQEKVNETIKCEDNNEVYNQWLQSLRKLAEGLRALDGVGKNSLESDMWSDSKIILEKGLKQAISEEKLEDNFYKFLDKSLELLNKEFFLLSFDDIDTNFTKGEEVLETLRKYLRYPKVITILAGDMDLFIKLIRKKNWPQFTTLLKNNDYTQEQIKSTIDHLEEQYLLKVLPGTYRIELLKLYDLLEEYSFEFTDNNKTFMILNKNSTNKNKNDLFVFLNQTYFQISPHYTQDKKAFFKALTSLPLRTTIQFIRLKNQIEKNTQNKIEKNIQVVFLNKILSLFSSLLFNFQIKDNDLLRDNTKFISELAIILTKNKEKIEITESYRLKPIFSDNDTNTFMLIFNILTNYHLSKNFSNVFSYMLKVGLTRETILSWPYDRSISTMEYIKHVGLNENEFPIKMARRYCGFIYDMTINKHFYNGYLKTYMHQEYLVKSHKLKDEKDPKRKTIPKYLAELIVKKKLDAFTATIIGELKTEDFSEEYKVLITKLQTNNISIKKNILINTHESLNSKLTRIQDKFLLNLLFMQVSSAYASTNSYCSTFPIIGLISELLMSDNLQNKNLEIFIKNHITTLSQIRTFVAFNGKNEKNYNYNFNNAEEEEEDYDNKLFDEEVNNESSTIDQEFLTNLKEWILNTKKVQKTLPVHIIAKIWTRFYYSLENIAMDRKNKHLGKVISLQITQFLNAWVVETLLYTQKSINISLTNTISSSKNFKRNYQEFLSIISEDPNNSYLQFCQQVCNFPLWKYYLDEQTQNILIDSRDGEKEIPKIIYTVNKKEIEFNSLEPLLNTVIIAKQR